MIFIFLYSIGYKFGPAVSPLIPMVKVVQSCNLGCTVRPGRPSKIKIELHRCIDFMHIHRSRTTFFRFLSKSRNNF